MTQLLDRPRDVEEDLDSWQFATRPAVQESPADHAPLLLDGSLLISEPARMQEEVVQEARFFEIQSKRKYFYWTSPERIARVSKGHGSSWGLSAWAASDYVNSSGYPSQYMPAVNPGLQDLFQYLNLYASKDEERVESQLRTWQHTVVSQVHRVIAGTKEVPESVVLLFNSPSKNVEYELWPCVASGPIESVPLARIRDELQIWFCASLEEMAAMLGLAYATFVNIAKDTRSPRPGSLRKVMDVYGRAKELRRVWGAAQAEAWLRSSGRELLQSGRLDDFRMATNRVLFPIQDKPRLGAKAARQAEAESISGLSNSSKPEGFRRR